MDKKLKFYVVRIGRETGIFNSREDCKKNVNGFPNAKYKCFCDENDAKLAIHKGRKEYYNNLGNKSDKQDRNEKIKTIPFFANSIAVDAACSDNPGKMEYRGVNISTGEEIFHENFNIGTNNIGEFLAIVHGLQYLGNNNDVIYSDSKIGISRVTQGKCKTKLDMNSPYNTDLSLLSLKIQQAEMWLKKNGITHKIFKWNTEERGEIPADFGRK